jgi:hypothetical protein
MRKEQNWQEQYAIYLSIQTIKKTRRMKRMTINVGDKVKIIAFDCVNHVGAAKCCEYDFRTITVDVVEVEPDARFLPYRIQLPCGKKCWLDANEIVKAD